MLRALVIPQSTVDNVCFAVVKAVTSARVD